MPARSIDPTKTTAIRRRFMAEATRRFRELAKLIRQIVVDEDAFGLRAPDPLVVPLVVNRGRFEFARSSDKVSAFMEWLNQAAAAEILEVRPGTPVSAAGRVPWADTYIETAYQRGIADAGRKLRGAGVKVEDSWIQSAFNRPVHADRAGLIFTRVYGELKGVTDAMDSAISRELALGIAEGRNPLAIARTLTDRVQKIGITRARVIARTEVIAAHAEATLNAFEEAGVDGVEVESEFSTAGDSRVCQTCAALEGRVYTIAESRGVIPVHPNCRCAFLPVIKDGSGIVLNYRRFRRAA
jgi:SPP1 gp7 family putative phage head morphogenesis protein